MPFHIVLIEPEIPTNTGNIGRLALATGCHLHLVGPLGFDISDKRVKRAGLDYWKYVNLHVHQDIDAFFTAFPHSPKVCFSSHATKNFWDLSFREELFLIFGKESVGLSTDIRKKLLDEQYKIPLYSPHIRSINLANAVGIVVYEGLRQLNSAV